MVFTLRRECRIEIEIGVAVERISGKKKKRKRRRGDFWGCLCAACVGCRSDVVRCGKVGAVR